MRNPRLKDRLLSRVRYSPRMGPLWGRLQSGDDYDWDHYPEAYREEMVGLAERHTTQLANVSWSIEEGRIVLPGGTKALHPYHRLLYETALRLQPESLFEFGCGGGDHLANLHVLLPNAKIYGVDISLAQVVYARERNGNMLGGAWLKVRDMTRPEAVAGLEGWAELVYCQAVIMHVHGRHRHYVFMKNMGIVSKRYLIFIENWQRHNFVQVLQRLFPGLALYVVSMPGAVGLVVDKKNALDCPVVHSDRELRALSAQVGSDR